MSNEVFDIKIFADKLSKLNNSAQCIESLSHWCVSNRKKARQIVETWEKMFKSSQKEQCVPFLYLANDILQNSRRKGSDFVNEFWKVLPAALKHVHANGDVSGKRAATRLVEIWEERKVFGSRAQSLRDELMTNKTNEPAPQVSNENVANPIKIVKKDAQSMRIKLAVGGFPEKIVSAFHCVHDECSNEEHIMGKCNVAVHSVERMLKEVENISSQGIQPATVIPDEMQEQENILHECARQLEGAELTRVTLVSLLQEAIQDQIARSRINEVGILRSKLSSHNHGVSSAPVHVLTEPPMAGELNNPSLQASSLQIPLSQPIGSQQIPAQQVSQTPSQRTAAFAPMAVIDEESKKAAAAAVAAKLASFTSSAQMLTSVLSSLVAEEAASKNDGSKTAAFSSSLPTFSPGKRVKLEQPSSGTDPANLDAGSSPYFTHLQQPISNNQVLQSIIPSSLGPPPPPPPPPPLMPTMMHNMMPYGFNGGNSLPPPPPLPSHVAMNLARPLVPPSPQPLQPPLQLGQHQNASGGFYRPPGIGIYTSNNQPSTSPMQRQ
ncbi:uncharacterized protein LOC130818743 isoform X2 [Amaranthus tricolor]|uniref:uncharacterized protein LOC130818743 isoform X2 n=1 Tax=Amaranthus tricolor TaxID=29722 RepID=UPI00258685EE|nr:uncharacterized protein LOC130818743 isoform X2 [Amaranthus tricolor]